MAKDQAKDQVFQIRMSAEDVTRIRKAAKEEFLDASVWARKIIMEALAIRDKK
jgi:hypothetical protein